MTKFPASRGGPPHRGNQPHNNPGQRGPVSTIPVLFDPAKTDTELFDSLAYEQADKIPEQVNSSQLRRYFSELKGLFNQFRSLVAGEPAQAKRQEVYAAKIEPRFKMLRSKLAYGRRPGARGSLQKDFAHVLEQGIAKVSDAKEFERFVLHIEAVVGFMYGNGKVSKS